MCELVQETMAQWGQALGRDLQWMAFEHDDPGHPHVHVVVAGYASGRQVGLYERDINSLRTWSERERERQAERTRERNIPEHRSIEQEIERIAKLDRERDHDRGWDRGR
jgi:type IV secretory pathway VirD2 relaxase